MTDMCAGIEDGVWSSDCPFDKGIHNFWFIAIDACASLVDCDGNSGNRALGRIR